MHKQRNILGCLAENVWNKNFKKREYTNYKECKKGAYGNYNTDWEWIQQKANLKENKLIPHIC